MHNSKDADAVGGIQSSGPLYIGAGKDLDAANFFFDLIDDVRIYNQSLSAKDIVFLLSISNSIYLFVRASCNKGYCGFNQTTTYRG